VAKRAAASERISNEAEDQIREARKGLAEMNSTVSDAKASLEKMKANLALTELVTDAQNDDRNAFYELRKIAADPNNPLAQKAESAWKMGDVHRRADFVGGRR
jgi:NADH pyrophosphatase NudC (nudix superfamily)